MRGRWSGDIFRNTRMCKGPSKVKLPHPVGEMNAVESEGSKVVDRLDRGS